MELGEIIITSTEEYIHEVSLLRGTTFFTSTTNLMPIYRGQANKEWILEPAVYREHRFKNESNYIREIERIEPEAFSALTRMEKLIKMQHYGLPTRLVDFTYNSLVALYFACCSHFDKDGIVFEIHAFPLYNQDFIWLSIVMKYIYEFGKLPLDPYVIINELKEEPKIYPTRGVEEFFNIDSICKILSTPHGIYPKFTNKRIKNQDGVFILFGMDRIACDSEGIIFKKQSFTTIEELWPQSRSIIIPSNQKKQILLDLNRLGINQWKLFGELESQTQHVINYIDSQNI